MVTCQYAYAYVTSSVYVVQTFCRNLGMDKHKETFHPNPYYMNRFLQGAPRSARRQMTVLIGELQQRYVS